MTRKLYGTIFSDLGQASLFMSLGWVQKSLAQRLGYAPYPATLNVRPKSPEDAQLWQDVQKYSASAPLSTGHGGFCHARLYFVRIQDSLARNEAIRGAVLVPEVADYPVNKIEVIAPVRLKEAFGVVDGDQLVLEFGD